MGNKANIMGIKQIRNWYHLRKRTLNTHDTHEVVEEALLNVRNSLTIIITLLNPDDGNLGIALPPVFHIFHFILQNIRSMDKMYQDQRDSLIRGACTFIFLCLTWYAFKLFRDQAPLFDPGALIGFGVLGFIGLIGFHWGHWNGIIAIIFCFLGGCIVSGIFRWRHREQPNDNGQRAVGYGQRAVEW